MALLDRCSYSSTRMALFLLNGFYLFVAVLLISTGGYALNAAIVTSTSVAGGIIAAGVLLAAVALLGLYGTRSQHQAALFFYMIILIVVFVVQASVAISCLSANSSISLSQLVTAGWEASSKETRWDAEKAFGCCGLHSVADSLSNCRKLPCWSTTGCPACLYTIVDLIGENLSRIGWIGLLFSFTELAGVALAYRFRNTVNPGFNPVTLFN